MKYYAVTSNENFMKIRNDKYFEIKISNLLVV